VAGIPLAIVKLLIRFILVTAILAYMAVAAGLVVTRYWVLPRIDQWRPEIQDALSQAVGTPVRFDSISANWRGLNADLKITNLTILDEQNVAQLGVPVTEAIVSWRSILALEPVFRYIGVTDVIVVARRSEQGKLYVGGFELDTDSSEHSLFWQSPGVQWLLKQGRVNIDNSRLVWIDQMRRANPLVIEDIDLSANNSLIGHKLEVKATLPAELGGTLEFVANIDSVSGPMSRLLRDEPDGFLYASASQLNPQALRAWVDLPDLSGNFAGRLWLDVLDGKLTNFTASLAGRDNAFRPTALHRDAFRLGQFRWQVSGPLALLGAHLQFPNYVETARPRQRLASSLTLEKGYFSSPASGMAPIYADQVSADLSFSRPTPQGFRVDVQDATFANPDGLMTARGSWTLDDRQKGGLLDLKGTLVRFKLPTLHNYLPDTIGEDASNWLATAFTSGIVPRASFEVAGLVDDFPFGVNSGPGKFQIDGSVQDWSIDYLPVSEDGELPWPPLSDLNGQLALLNDRITVDISAGSLMLPKGERISLSALTAEIADLEGDPVLTIEGQTRAQADDYLALFKDTGVRDLAPVFVRDIAGKGDWQMPLTLRVPLGDVEQTSFTGKLGLNGGSVAYGDSPEFTEVTGVALLSQEGFESKGLAANFLGGKLSIAGGLTKQLDTVSVKGDFDWSNLAKFTDSPIAASWLQGKMTYDVNATVKDETFDVTLTSDMVGTRVALPAPLGLSTGQSAPLRLKVSGKLTGSSPQTVSLTLANRLALAATTAPSRTQNGSPVFQAVSLALGSAKPIAGGGLTVAATLPTIKLEDWMPVIDAVTKEIDSASESGPSLFPPLVAARLQTDTFTMQSNRFEKVAVDLSVRNSRQYVATIASLQTNGSVQWAVDRGTLQDGFLVRLDQLELGNHDNGEKAAAAPANQTKAALPKPGTLSNLPRLDIEVKDLTLYGVRVGEFHLKGRNSPNRRQWQINSLMIKNPHAELTASGSCRFNERPGVTLDAELKIADLGELTKFLGQGERVRKGRGTIKANIDWQKLPWQFDYEGLTGKAELNLEEGVFDHVNSSSARVLELLSMQSFNRILDANINPDESFRQGFPWSSINGSFDITKGLVDTKNLAINSPVATISLQGQSSLVTETWDLEASVRPNLDLSGTALATGFLMNPIIGLSALVGQYLLRNPVEAALSQRYYVSGPWDEPKVVSGANPNNKPEPVASPPALIN